MPWFRFLNTDRLTNLLILTGLTAGLAAANSPLGLFHEYAHHATVHLGAGRLPKGVTWTQGYGAAAVAAIGFTMSLFVAALAFPDPQMPASAKLAVLTASMLSASAGLVVLHVATRHSKPCRQ